MTVHFDQLIHGYLDGTLNSEEFNELSRWLNVDRNNARHFAQVTLLHNSLQNIYLKVEGINSEHEASISNHVQADWKGFHNSRLAKRFLWIAASVFLMLAGTSWVWIGSSTASAAFRELDRVIASSVFSRDRTYQIIVEQIKEIPPRESREERKRPPKPPLDRALLYLRGNDQFVLVRQTDFEQSFITGSDGKQSWAIPPNSGVKVSSDLNEFNRDLPGHESSIPLTNLHEGLENLKKGYQLHFSEAGPEESVVQEGNPYRLMTAIKKPKVRGPQRVEIAYELDTGRIQYMRFIQMPYGQQRLDLRLNLLDESPLSDDFFQPGYHHSGNSQKEIRE